MKNILLSVFILVLAVALSIGIAKYKQIDKAMRIVVVLLIAQLVSEIIAYSLGVMQHYNLRYTMYHVYNIVEMFLQALFFIYAIRPLYNKKQVATAAALSILFGLLDILFLEPINTLNKDFIMLEGFCTITLSLYFIYWLLKNDVVNNIFRYPHFWIASFLLLLWSVTFFFWVFVAFLYSSQWPYINIAMYIQAIVSIIAYFGIGLVLFYYPKQLNP
jgi:hypothetical protein